MKGVLLALGLCSLLLAGCKTDDTAKVKAAAQASFNTLCAARVSLHSIFLTYASTGKVKQKVVVAEAQGYAAIDTVCKNPPTDITSAVAIAAAAYTAMIVAKSRAEDDPAVVQAAATITTQ